jgi:cobalt-zinc-cadmium efflux system outer membrane protein
MSYAFRVSLCLGVISVVVLAQEPAQRQLLTVDDLIQRAVERNRDVSALRLRVAEAQRFLRQAGIRPVPTMEFSGSSGRPLATKGEEEFSAGYFYPIETGGKRQKRVRVAEKDVQLAEAELAERVRQVTAEVRTRFIDAIADQRKLDAINGLLQVNREALRLTQSRVEQGDVAPLDRDLLAVEVSRAEAQRSPVLGRLAAALLDLRRVAALEPSETLAPRELPMTPPSLRAEELQEHALKTRPDLLIARLLEDQGGASVELAEAEGKPNLTVAARYARRNSRFDDQLGLTPSGALTQLRDQDDVLTVGISIPLLTRKRNIGNIEAAEARLAGARLRRQYLEGAVPLEVMAAWERYLAARRALDIYDRGVVEQSEKNLAVIRGAYNLGQLRILDVLNEQRRLIDTQLGAIDARAEEARSLTELMRTVGGNLP